MLTRTLATAPARVLIVDDDKDNIDILAEALTGFDLRFASRGTRALELAVDQPLDLILLAVAMPGMDGFEALRWLKSEPRTRNIPVILITTAPKREDEQRGFALGAVDYIVEPISPAIVRARVRTHTELKRQRDFLEAHASIDGLTGIANRSRFDEELARAWHTAQRSGQSLTLMLIDIDYFQRYNEHYGHSPGDECLRRVAVALHRAFSRGDDLAARYGPAEFALMLAGTEGVGQTLRVLEAIHALEIPHARSDASVWISVSIGAIATAAAPGSSPHTAMAVADDLLYLAKQGGRDRGEFQNLGTGERATVIRPTPATRVETVS